MKALLKLILNLELILYFPQINIRYYEKIFLCCFVICLRF